MLRGLEVKNCRSIRTLNLDFPAADDGTRLTVLVGPNAVGKSSIIGAILLVRDLVAGPEHAGFSVRSADLIRRSLRDPAEPPGAEQLEVALTFDVADQATVRYTLSVSACGDITGVAFTPEVQRALRDISVVRAGLRGQSDVCTTLRLLRSRDVRAYNELLVYLHRHIPETKGLFEGFPEVFLPCLLSIGTLSLIELLVVALHPAPPATCVIVEEPEAHLHPGLMPLVADLLRLLSRRTTVLVKTHSPWLVAAMSPESVVVVERKPGDDDTQVKRLSKSKDSLRKVLRVMDLGEAWMNGFFGGLPAVIGSRLLGERRG